MILIGTPFMMVAMLLIRFMYPDKNNNLIHLPLIVIILFGYFAYNLGGKYKITPIILFICIILLCISQSQSSLASQNSLPTSSSTTNHL